MLQRLDILYLKQGGPYTVNRYIFKENQPECLNHSCWLDKGDPGGMHRTYDRWPEIAEESYSEEYGQAESGGVSDVVFAGMGGSGAIGDVLYSMLSKTGIHVSVVKGYVLPRTAGPGTLVVSTSISGNTRETLTVIEAAREAGCQTACFCSGGEMLEYCTRHKMPHWVVPMHHSPRTSFPSFLYAMLSVLGGVIPVDEKDVRDSISDMRELRSRISPEREDNPALELARWIKGMPVIYYPWGLQAAAVRFKNSLQENAKCHVIAEDVIEACHNGIVSWEGGGNAQPILIEGADDYYKTKERWAILRGFFESRGIGYREVRSVKGGVLSKIINLVYLLDYASIYLAVLRGVEPSPVPAIDYIKRHL
ncbi:glucose-6-phosphate isomerase [Cenarchaeum symbiosum A]|uniref:Glucose-6-phosphate isomerase n=1 Tax=Cenarchaeum symbiosum (strain A) TaxID=414004 RepID=A0RV56_CENSY|nr:glucose-6-phosphate isomerase [Cenarchaeum symbiosum A]